MPHHGTEQDDHRSRGFQRRAAQMELRYQPHAPGRQGGDAEPERRGGDYLRGAQVYAAAAAAAHGDTPGASIVPGAGGMASAVALQQAGGATVTHALLKIFDTSTGSLSLNPYRL